MELNYIHDFLVLAELGNYYKAADTLFLSQPTLSKRIKALEKELGFELFDRTGKKTSLTEFGRSFLPYAKKLDEIRLAYQKDLFTHDESHIITLGISSLFSSPDIAAILTPLKEFLTEIQINVLQCDEITLIEKLKHGECDLLMISNPDSTLNSTFDTSLYQITPLFHHPLAAVLSENHPLFHEESITIDQLAGEPYISLGNTPKWDSKLGEPIIFAERIGLIINLIRQGFGISVLPCFSGLFVTNGDVKAVPISDSQEIHISLVSPRRRRDAVLMQKIATYLKQIKF